MSRLIQRPLLRRSARGLTNAKPRPAQTKQLTPKKPLGKRLPRPRLPQTMRQSKTSRPRLADHRFAIENDAVAVGFTPTFAEEIAQQVIRRLRAYQTAHPHATPTDERALIARELEKIHPKLSDFYRNRDKII